MSSTKAKWTNIKAVADGLSGPHQLESHPLHSLHELEQHDVHHCFLPRCHWLRRRKRLRISREALPPILLHRPRPQLQGRCRRPKNVKVVVGSHGDTALIERTAKAHNVTLNVADSDDLALIGAIIKGQEAAASSAARKPIFIHTRYACPTIATFESGADSGGQWFWLDSRRSQGNVQPQLPRLRRQGRRRNQEHP